MEEQCSNSELDTGKGDRAVWLMKCPSVVSRSWQDHSSSDSPRPFAKVVLSIDPLRPNDDTSSSQCRNQDLVLATRFENLWALNCGFPQDQRHFL
ncbi:hypothetical protein HHK36_016572 [Tetracentron sinense]|uniref:TFIIF beta subunit N-terminal domain-containing protein n=1 Tax=Tetracentron sinense TaxID=13715 RepID=A0A835DEC4_TETSI|nr:hypothetical protein HHK36_016572 [Tetracentron sinense]